MAHIARLARRTARGNSFLSDREKELRVLEAMEQVLAVPVTIRGEWLKGLAQADSELGARVEDLLRRDRLLEETDHVAGLVDRQAVGVLTDRQGQQTSPRRIGAYEIVEVIGRGGFGVVFRAIQENPRRPVALKLLSAPLVEPTIRRRFEREAEILALLRH